MIISSTVTVTVTISISIVASIGDSTANVINNAAAIVPHSGGTTCLILMTFLTQVVFERGERCSE